MRPDDERQEAEDEQRVDHQAVAPERLARVVGDHLGDDAHRRQDQHVDLGVAEEPEQVLPQQRVAAAGDVERLAADDEAARQEEAGAAPGDPCPAAPPPPAAPETRAAAGTR